MSPKPYFDSIRVRSALLKLIEMLSASPEKFPSETIEQMADGMYRFYRNPAPAQFEYIFHKDAMETDSFKSKYDRLSELLLTKLPKARKSSSRYKYSSEAITLATELWEMVYDVIETNGGGYVAQTTHISP
jgi:hypothetical protein